MGRKTVLSFFNDVLHRPVLSAERILLNRQLLDQQVVDAGGRKLLRVNDVRLQIDADGLRVVGIETGVSSLLLCLSFPRRLLTL